MSKCSDEGCVLPAGHLGMHLGNPVADEPSEAVAIFERGGYVAIDSRGIEAVRRSLPGLGFDAVADAVSRKWEAEVSASFDSRPSVPMTGLDVMLPPLSPAAMLGEAAELIMRASALIMAAKGRTARCQGLFARAGGFLEDARETVAELQSDAASTGWGEPNACWQCDAPLGTTEACLTCAAKRRETSP